MADKVIQLGNLYPDTKYKNCIRGRFYSTGGVCPTLNSCNGGQREPKFLVIRQPMDDNTQDLTYHSEPTDEELIEYFGLRLGIRKMSPREALRLMDVSEEDIDKMMNAEETVTLKDGTVKTKKAIPKSALYKLAGNSIVVSCLYYIFRNLFIPSEQGQPINLQQTLNFDEEF